MQNHWTPVLFHYLPYGTENNGITDKINSDFELLKTVPKSAVRILTGNLTFIYGP